MEWSFICDDGCDVSHGDFWSDSSEGGFLDLSKDGPFGFSCEGIDSYVFVGNIALVDGLEQGLGLDMSVGHQWAFEAGLVGLSLVD